MEVFEGIFFIIKLCPLSQILFKYTDMKWEKVLYQKS